MQRGYQQAFRSLLDTMQIFTFSFSDVRRIMSFSILRGFQLYFVFLSEYVFFKNVMRLRVVSVLQGKLPFILLQHDFHRAMHFHRHL